MLRKGVYPYEYMDDWEKLNEKLLSEKEDFYSHLSMEDITDTDYMHARRVCKDFIIANLGKYHDLYGQSDTSVLADVFENFQNTCLEIYELNPSRLFTAPGLAWQVALKNTKVKLNLLSDMDMLLMAEKRITEGIYQIIH